MAAHSGQCPLPEAAVSREEILAPGRCPYVRRVQIPRDRPEAGKRADDRGAHTRRGATSAYEGGVRRPPVQFLHQAPFHGRS